MSRGRGLDSVKCQCPLGSYLFSGLYLREVRAIGFVPSSQLGYPIGPGLSQIFPVCTKSPTSHHSSSRKPRDIDFSMYSLNVGLEMEMMPNLNRNSGPERMDPPDLNRKPGTDDRGLMLLPLGS